MATSSLRASGEIARQVRSQMSLLGYVRPERGSASASSGFRDRVLSGYSSIRILDTNRFETSFTSQQFNDSLRRDLFDGALRVKRLEATVLQLLDAHAATAWTLTTCYYTSFFSAIELLRCSGTFISYFDREAIEKITQRASVPVPATIEDGSYHGTASYSSMENEVIISFAKKKFRHHQFTWSEVRRIVARAGADLTGVDGIEQRWLEQFIGNESPYWPSPSDVRNEWNYEDAALFGSQGETRGSEFRKLAKSRVAAAGWVRKFRRHASPEIKAASLAFVMSVLVAAMENVIRVGLADNDEKKIIELTELRP